MSQDVDVKLQVWKDLAISKQILMGAATDALGLDAECSTEELKVALNQAIERAMNADVNIQKIRSQAEQQVAEYKKNADIAEQARTEAEAVVAASLKAREQAERQLAQGKADNTEALKKARADVADKQNKLKAISKSLADTPENVVRKLKTLKKQKLDEAKLRNQAESKLQQLRKDKNKQDLELETQKAALADVGKLIEQIKVMHETCEKGAATIKELSKKKKDQLKVPNLDTSVIESIEKILEEQS